jgi:hypothetical protein
VTCPGDSSSSRDPSLTAEAQAGARGQQERHGGERSQRTRRSGCCRGRIRGAARVGPSYSSRVGLGRVRPVPGARPGRVRVLKTSRRLIVAVQCPPSEIKPEEGGEPGESGRMRPVPRLDGGGDARAQQRGRGRARRRTLRHPHRDGHHRRHGAERGRPPPLDGGAAPNPAPSPVARLGGRGAGTSRDEPRRAAAGRTCPPSLVYGGIVSGLSPAWRAPRRCELRALGGQCFFRRRYLRYALFLWAFFRVGGGAAPSLFFAHAHPPPPAGAHLAPSQKRRIKCNPFFSIS